MRPAFAFCALLFALPTFAATPEEAWKAGIADENRDYAQIRYAMLKIQDAAYLHDGQSAVLNGKPGDPSSWHWHYDSKAQGPLKVAFTNGALTVSKDGKPLDPARIERGIAVSADIDVRGEKTQVDADVQGWRIFVYNQKNPAAAAFKGVSYFPYDPAFRVAAAFIADRKLPPRIFRTSRGTGKDFYHAGDAVFTLKGRKVTLPFYSDSNAPGKIDSLTAFYTDGTTGKGGYGAGRYVDVDHFGAFPPTRVTIDFNDAYNPNCARSAFFTCPIAVDRIALAMTAGERDPHYP